MENKTSLPPISDILRSPVLPEVVPPAASYSSYPIPHAHAYNYYNYPLPSADYYVPRIYVSPAPAPYQYTVEATPRLRPDVFRRNVDSAYTLPGPASYSATQHLPRLSVGQRGSTASESSHVTSVSSTPTSPGSAGVSPKAEYAAPVQVSKVRTRTNLPKKTTQILLKWLNEHLSHPYPNSFEKAQLMMSTGLNQQQLSNWFINARRRKIKSLKIKQNS